MNQDRETKIRKLATSQPDGPAFHDQASKYQTPRGIAPIGPPRPAGRPA